MADIIKKGNLVKKLPFVRLTTFVVTPLGFKPGTF